MKKCPYCTGEIAAEAVKCKHCGEWVTAPPPPARGEDGLRLIGEAMHKEVNFGIVWAVVGLVVTALFFFGFLLPQIRKSEMQHDEFRKNFDKGRQEFDRKWDERPGEGR